MSLVSDRLGGPDEPWSGIQLFPGRDQEGNSVHGKRAATSATSLQVKQTVRKRGVELDMTKGEKYLADYVQAILILFGRDSRLGVGRLNRCQMSGLLQGVTKSHPSAKQLAIPSTFQRSSTLYIYEIRDSSSVDRA
jgi:hypothetical protein